MLLLNNRLENVSIMSLQTGSKLGVATKPIIDPRKLQIVAYYVQGSGVHEASVLHCSDIREVSPLGFIVDSVDSIMTLDDSLVRLQEVIGFDFSLIGKSVKDNLGRKLGKVNEYSAEIDSFFIQKMHVSQSVVKNLTSSHLAIHRSQIIEVTDKQIIVRSATIPKTTGLTQVLNPFRKDPRALTPDPINRLEQ